MRTYNANPYRILGITGNATAAEKLAAKNKISAFLKIEKPPVLELDLAPPLDKIERTQDLIDLKSNEILAVQDRIEHSLYWFVSGGTIDEIGLNSVKSNQIEKAFSNFKNGINDSHITSKNIASVINHSTLEIVYFKEIKDQERLKIALNKKIEISRSETYLSFLAELVSKDHNKFDADHIKKRTVETAKSILKDLFPEKNQSELFYQFFSVNKQVVKEYEDEISKKTLVDIKSVVSKFQSKRKELTDKYADSNNTDYERMFDEFAREGTLLLDQSNKLLKELKSMLGKEHPSVSVAFETVIEEVNYLLVVPLNNVFDTLKSKKSREELRALFKILVQINCDSLEKMARNAIIQFSEVKTPTFATLEKNLESLLDFRKFLSEIKLKLDQGESENNSPFARLIFWGVIIFILYNLKNC